MIELFLNAALADNLALVHFLGMCAALAVRADLPRVLATGAVVLVTLAISVPLDHLLYQWLLAPGAWDGFDEMDLSSLRFILFIAVIATILQMLQLLPGRVAPSLQALYGVHLRLAGLGSVLLGANLFMTERQYDLAESLVHGLGSGAGWALAMAAFAALRIRLRYSDMPAGMDGPAAGFFAAGLLSAAFLVLGEAVAP